MRAVKKLERRFRDAVEKMDAGANTQSVDTSAIEEENANLAKKITRLEAEKAEKDKKIDVLNTDLTGATTTGTAAAKEVADLQVLLEKAKNEATATSTQIANLQDKVKGLEAGGATTSEDAAKVASLETEITELNSKVEEIEANSLNYFARMRKLRGSLRQLRDGLKESNIVNAEDINNALQAELDAIQSQRALDLDEINTVLEKLTPLVEGK